MSKDRTFQLTESAAEGFQLLRQEFEKCLHSVLEDAERMALTCPADQRKFFSERLATAFGYYTAPIRALYFWLFNSRENTNFTYDLTELNQKYLASVVALVTGVPAKQISSYLTEVIQDRQLADHIRARTAASGSPYADEKARFGRRIGWYAVVRATKPRLVVETGVDKGLGSCVLSAALMANTREGYPGRYLGTDINPETGFLYGDPYAQFGHIAFGDSIESLTKLNQPIDVFINDSDHSKEYEAREYRAIKDKLSPRAVIIGDNSHITPELHDFAADTGRRFVFFEEKPRDHWYPGSGIGFAF